LVRPSGWWWSGERCPGELGDCNRCLAEAVQHLTQPQRQVGYLVPSKAEVYTRRYETTGKKATGFEVRLRMMKLSSLDTEDVLKGSTVTSFTTTNNGYTKTNTTHKGLFIANQNFFFY